MRVRRWADALAGGAAGVISVASNVVPRAFARICALAAAGQAAGAVPLGARLQDLSAYLGIEPHPIPVKALLALAMLGAVGARRSTRRRVVPSRMHT